MNDKIRYGGLRKENKPIIPEFDMASYLAGRSQCIWQSSPSAQQPTAVAELRGSEELFLLRRRFRQEGIVVK